VQAFTQRRANEAEKLAAIPESQFAEIITKKAPFERLESL